MSWLGDHLLHVRLFRASLSLGAPDDLERLQAIEALQTGGNASLPWLRRALHSSYSRTQFGAAIALHRLGDADGISTLLEALRWRLQAEPEMAAELEAAFLAIGAPDAVTALLTLWPLLSVHGEHTLALTSLCRIWASLPDPRALHALIERAPQLPELFEQTVPAFGTNGLPALQRMAQDADPVRRRLAVQAIGHIVSEFSFQSLIPMLRDSDPDVRQAVPAALESSGGVYAAARAVEKAIRDGYSSRSAVQLLVKYGAMPYDTLLELVARWNPHALTPQGDTQGAVLAALHALAGAPWPGISLTAPLCALLEKHPPPEVAAEAARVLGLRGQNGHAGDSLVRDTLRSLLAETSAEVREEASLALERLGESFGLQFVRLVEDCRPQGNLLGRLQSVLRGEADAGQVATQAVQQVSQWVARFSREAAEKLANVASASGSPATGLLPGGSGADLLRLLLHNALNRLERAASPAEIEAMLSLAASAARALGRLGAPFGLAGRDELLRSLRTVRYSTVSAGVGGLPLPEMREVGGLVRGAAAEALFTLYRSDSFPLFLEALYAPTAEVHETAIYALGRLGEVRALPHLQPVAGEATHPLALAASEAIASIKRINPEMMTLLRASSSLDNRPDTLLRPAAGSPQQGPEMLLRPSTSVSNPVPEG